MMHKLYLQYYFRPFFKKMQISQNHEYRNLEVKEGNILREGRSDVWCPLQKRCVKN